MSIINPAVCLLNKIYVSKAIVDTAPGCFFLLKNRMKGIFVYVLEFMLTLAKMQNNSTLM